MLLFRPVAGRRSCYRRQPFSLAPVLTVIRITAVCPAAKIEKAPRFANAAPRAGFEIRARAIGKYRRTMKNWRTRLRSLLGCDPDMAPRICYSQDGEDLFLDRMIDGAPNGFYVDVGAAAGVLPYYQFNEPALNTFERKDKPPYRITGRVDVAVQRLVALLDQHLPAGQTIDLLTVDVKGKDLEVLESNNWQRYRPRLILEKSLARSTKRQRAQ